MTFRTARAVHIFAFSALIMLMGTVSYAQQTPNQTAERIMAVVNDDIITTSEFSERVHMVMETSNLPKNPEVARQIGPQILDAMVDEKLQLQEAKRLGLDVSDAEVNDGLKQIATKNKMELPDFAQMLKKEGISAYTLAQQVKAQIAWTKVIQQRIRPRIDITDSDIDARIKRLQDLAGKDEYLIAEIFLPFDEEQSEDDIRGLAQNLYDQLVSGKAGFPMLAQQFSKGAGADQGGVIGWVQEGQVAATIEAALKQAEAGNLLAPIETDLGYHIVYLRDKREIEYDPETTNMLVLRAEIGNDIGNERLDSRARRYLRDLRSTAFIEYRA